MKPFSRSDRVSGQIQKTLSDLLHRDIKDPRIDGVVITGVKMARDLKSAKIYFTTPGAIDGDEKLKDEAVKGFNSALGYIKRTLAGKLGLRYMPDLKFFYDESFAQGARIEAVLKTIKKDDGSSNTTS